MKRMIRSTALLLAAVAIMTAVGVRVFPQEEAVAQVQDGSSKFIESEQYGKYVAPANWSGSFTARNGQLTVGVDADITVPDVDRYPVYAIGEKHFTEEEIQQIVNVLMDGKEVTYMAPTVDDMSQAEIEAELEKWKEDLKEKQAMSDTEQGLHEASLPDEAALPREASLSNVIDWEKRLIDSLEEMLQVANGTYVPTVWDGKFEQDGPTLDGLTSVGVGVERYDGDVHRWFSYGDPEDQNGSLRYFVNDPNCRVGGKVTDWNDSMTGSTTTPEQAKDIVGRMLADMGVGDLRLEYAGAVPYGDNSDRDYTFETLPRCHALHYTRYIDGIPVSLVNNAMYDSSGSHFFEESLYVYLTDQGVYEFNYYSPIEVREKVASNVALLPFEQIMSQFEDFMSIAPQYAADGDAGILSRKVNIDRISLGFAYVPAENGTGEMYLVPTWEFYGTALNKYSEKYSDPNFNENNEWLDDTQYHSFMSINAIDGSMVEHHTRGTIIF